MELCYRKLLTKTLKVSKLLLQKPWRTAIGKVCIRYVSNSREILVYPSFFELSAQYYNCSSVPLSWNIARLKGADGGAGIGFLVDTIDAAYVASMTSSLYSMQYALSNSKTIIDNEINKESILTDLDYEIPSSLQSYFDSISYLSNMEVSLTQVNDNPIISLQTLSSLNKSSHKG